MNPLLNVEQTQNARIVGATVLGEKCLFGMQSAEEVG